MIKKKRVAILISGKGSNMRALIEDMMDEDHPGTPALIISDKKNAEGLIFAQKLNLKTLIITGKNQNTKDDFERQLLTELSNNKIDLICLAGFMRILSEKFITNYKKLIINIHPSLLPLFKGLNTHREALNSGMALHGATVHVVTPSVDSGKILGQAVVPIIKGDTEKNLKNRVLLVEHQLYPLVLRLVLNGETSYPILLEN